jgi:Cu(I)/Ag(I) efflux system protein CusF
MLNLVRLFAIGMAPIALASCAGAAPGSGTSEPNASIAMAVDLGSSVSRAPADPRSGQRGEGHEWSMPGAPGAMVQMVHEGHSGTHASGTVNTVDAAQHKVNVSHGPIPALGWPAMTMDFPVAPNVDLRSVKPGSRINFSLEKGKGGMYEIRSLQPESGK